MGFFCLAGSNGISDMTFKWPVNKFKVQKAKFKVQKAKFKIQKAKS
jgi:hypothetical protein